MTEMGSIFNPGEAEMMKHLASEKILPAPAPVPGPPMIDSDGDEVHIPSLEEILGDGSPAPAVLPPQARAAHKPDGSPNED